MSASEKPDFVLETYIKTTPEKLWTALTTGEMTKLFFQGNATVESGFKEGDDYLYTSAEGNRMLEGKILESNPFTRLAMTFNPIWTDKPKVNSHNLYEIEELANAVKLTISHFGVTPELDGVRNGWTQIAARLKTLLETGEALDLAAS